MKSMPIKSLLLSLFLILPALTFAGEIFGTIKKDGKPLVSQEVRFMQNGKLIGTAQTDEKGYFSIVLKPIGKMSLELPGYEGATYEVFSTNNSTGYTLSLVKAGDVWQLKKQ